MLKRHIAPFSLVLVVLSLLFAGCGSATSSTASSGTTCTGKTPAGVTTLTAWFSGGLDDLDALKAVIDSFNGSQSAVQIKEVTIPAATFGDQVKAAAASGTLPDILYLDGPNLYNYAWNKSLRALDSCIAPDVKADLLPSIVNQGTYNGKLYGVGSLDSGLALFTRKSILKAN
ncbi:MAG: extracellular solute-binding protein, partial [Ktedonobacterales bacterium]|nr:extracellular solute-binding protein [Ktedonobacterales bacterium]